MIPPPQPPLPPGLDMKLFVAHLANAGYVLQKAPSKPEAALTSDPPAPSDLNAGAAHKVSTSKSRYTRDPDRQPLQVQWCKRPSGTPGRGNFKVRNVLGMTRAGYSLVRRGIKGLLQRDEEIDMNKAITHNDVDAIARICHQAVGLYPEFEPFRKQKFWPFKAFIHIILKSSSGKYGDLRRELKNQEAEARGEVIERGKQKAKSPTTARARANVKAIKMQAKASGASNKQGTNDSDDNGDDNDGDDNEGDDANAMEMSFRAATPPNALAGTGEDAVGDLTHDLSGMVIDPTEDDEPEADTGPILAALHPQLASTPSSTHAPKPASDPSLPHKSPSVTPIAIHDRPAISVSTLVSAPKPNPTSHRPGPANPDHSAASTSTSVLPVAMRSPPVVSESASSLALPPSQPLVQDTAATTDVHIPTDDVFAQIAKINQLASSLGDVQRALMPPALLQTLDAWTALAPKFVLAPTPAPNPGIENTAHAFGDDDDDLSDPESASESNPPIVDRGLNPSHVPSQGGSNSKKSTKTVAKVKVVQSGEDDGEGESVGAKTARVIKAAKGARGAKGAMVEGQLDGVSVAAPGKKAGGRGKGKAVAVTANDEDRPVTTKQVPKRKTRSAANGKQA